MVPGEYIPITQTLKRRLDLTNLRQLYDQNGYLHAHMVETVREVFFDWSSSTSNFPTKSPSSLRPVLLSNGYQDWKLSSRALLVGDSLALTYLDWYDVLQTFLESIVGLEREIDLNLIIPLSEAAFDNSPGLRETHMMVGALRAFGRGDLLGPLEGMPGTQITECLIGLDLCSRYPDTFDLVSRDEKSTAAYRFLLESFVSVDPRVTGSHDRLDYFSKLLQLPLPDSGCLSPI